MLPQPVLPPDKPYSNLKKTVLVLLLVLFFCCSLGAAAGLQVQTQAPVNKSIATAMTTPVKLSTTTPLPVQTAVKTMTTVPVFVTAKKTTAPVPVPTSFKAPMTFGTISPSFTFLPATIRTVQTARPTPVACPSGWVACNGVCYCGQCGYQCPADQGYACINGACSRQCRGPYSDEEGVVHNEVYCNGRCTDLYYDNASCGSCGHTCLPGESCQLNGYCSLSCQWLGEWNWYPVENQHGHCGGCFNSCEEFEECVGRTCTCPGDASHILCNGICTDLKSDEKNCGYGCGFSCADNQRCENGACTGACADNQLFCHDHCYPQNYLITCGDCDHNCLSLDGQDHIIPGASCNIDQCFARCTEGGPLVNIDTSEEHCGYCGHACGPGETCQKGVCTCTDPDYVLCSNRCVNLSTDKSNCGYCYSGCHEVRAYCQNGQCQPPCPEWMTWCGEECVGLGIDRDNCGSCGHVCDHMCVLGICI
jgi:hypothetical protein